MDWPESTTSVGTGKHAVKWTLRTESEAYLDGLEAKLAKAKTPNLIPPRAPFTSTAGLGVQDGPSELDFDDEEEDDSLDQGDHESRADDGEESTGEVAEGSQGAALAEGHPNEGRASVNEDDPGLALLWDQPPPPPPLPLLLQQLNREDSRSSSVAASVPFPLTVPSSSGRTRRISFTENDSLRPPTTNSSSYTSSHLTSSTNSSPSSSFVARPNRYLHPSHREREASSHSQSSFATISESPPNSPNASSSGSGTVTPTQSSSQVHLPIPVPAPPKRSVRFNPRTLLRPSSYSSFASDRSGELISSSPMRGFMAWRLGGGPKPASAARSPSPNSSGPSNPVWSAKRPPPTSVQAWANYYGTFSDAEGGDGVTEIRGNPLGEQPYEGWRPSVPSEPRVRKSEEEVMFGKGWERMTKWEWWIWRAGLAEWWEGEPGGSGTCCFGGGWDDDDWGEHNRSDVRRVAGEGRGFF